ncbi:uncharacterized protein LOC144477256 [Augochlora pura]
MSSLIVAQDSQLMMLELAVENLYMPWTSLFDKALLKKTIIMFRMLDDEWVTMAPNRSDYRCYRGSSYETERFYGGKSVVFAVPDKCLEKPVEAVELQIYVYKQVSKFFELERQQNFGYAVVSVDGLLNGIIKDLSERKELEGYFSSDLNREPVSRSTRGTFQLLDENQRETEATLEVYIRISFLGRCILTETYAPRSIRKAFYAREETDDCYEYQFRELSYEDVESYHWGSATILPPLHPDKLMCDCQLEEKEQTTQTAEKRRKRRRDDYAARLAQIKKLLALMKKMRENRPEVMGQGEGPKKICPTTDAVCSPAPCILDFSCCSNSCAPSTVCCLPPPSSPSCWT